MKNNQRKKETFKRSLKNRNRLKEDIPTADTPTTESIQNGLEDEYGCEE